MWEGYVTIPMEEYISWVPNDKWSRTECVWECVCVWGGKILCVLNNLYLWIHAYTYTFMYAIEISEKKGLREFYGKVLSGEKGEH